MTDFEGFSAAALDFYEDLEDDNSRGFWAAHREVYEGEVRVPMVGLAAVLEDEFGPAKIFRPYRDVRFSKDKTPYKTHQGAFVRTADRTGLYVQIDAAGIRTGAGWYDADAEAKRRFRAAVVDNRSGRALERLLAALEALGYAIDGDRVKTRPRGWDADHPRIGLLRHNTLNVGRHHGDPDWLRTSEAVEHVRRDWRAFAPLIAWHRKHVGTTAAPGPSR